MSEQVLSAEDLLAGTDAVVNVPIPAGMLAIGDEIENPKKNLVIKIRPLSIGTFHLILKAAREDVTLIPLLMIKEAMVEPKISFDQIKNLQLGLTELLIENIRNISGLSEKKKERSS